MKLLLDCSEGASARELAGDLLAGQLLTPLTGYSRWSNVYAIDNGAFSRFEADRFEALLKREHKSEGCLWVCCPDVVGSARRTLELFRRKHKWIGPNWPVALVAQDGLEDLEVPWDEIACLFIGGTDKFKQSESSASLIKTAKVLGKLTHAGRVNTWQRWEWFESLGVDTCDGSGLARYDHMLRKVQFGLEQPKLFEMSEAEG